jgi:hypothetical protein
MEAGEHLYVTAVFLRVKEPPVLVEEEFGWLDPRGNLYAMEKGLP